MDLFLSFFSTKIAYASSLDSFISSVDTKIINPLIAFILALAVVYFLYGVLEFLMNQDNEEKKTDGKSHMLWGVIGIVIMFGAYFVMNVIIATFGIEGINPEKSPGPGQVTLPTYTPPVPNNLNQ